MDQQGNPLCIAGGILKTAQGNVRRSGAAAAIHTNGFLLLVIKLADINVLILGNTKRCDPRTHIC